MAYRDSNEMLHVIVVILLVCMGHVTFTMAQDSTMTKFRRNNLAQEHDERGIYFFNRGDYEKAIIEFEKAISLRGDNPMVYYFNGLSYERTGDLNKALLNYDLSLSLQPEFSEALFNRALVLFKLRRYDQALKDLELLLVLPPGETQAVFFRGIKYGEDDPDTGFNEIISMSRKEADIHNYMGLCHYHLGEFDMSNQHFRTALQLNPTDDNVHANAGLNYLALEDYDSARFHFRRSLEINPNNSVAQLNSTLANKGSIEDQIQQLDELIRKNRDFPMAFAQRAYQHYLAGDYRSAIADYDSALLFDPGNTAYLLERGMLYLHLKQNDRAIMDFSTVIQLDEENGQAWYNLANATYLNGDFTSSAVYYTQAISLMGPSADLYYNRSLAYYNAKNMDNACLDMKTAYDLGKEEALRFIHKYCR